MLRYTQHDKSIRTAFAGAEELFSRLEKSDDCFVEDTCALPRFFANDALWRLLLVAVEVEALDEGTCCSLFDSPPLGVSLASLDESSLSSVSSLERFRLWRPFLI